MGEDWITVGRFSTPMEAHFAQARLEMEGIDASLEGENTVAAHPFYSLAIGGVRLKVTASQAERAACVLAASAPNAAVQNSEETPFCPKCGSDGVERDSTSGVAALIEWLFLIPYLLRLNRWRCKQCGQRWKWR